MKQLFLKYTGNVLSFSLILLLFLASCKEEGGQYKELLTYMRTEVPPLSQKEVNLLYNGIKLTGDSIVRIPVMITRPVDVPVKVTIKADAELLASFNKQHNSKREMLPESSYSFKNVTIAQGSYGDTLKVEIDKKSVRSSSAGYLLPLHIASVSAGEISSNFGTYYILVNSSLSDVDESLLATPPVAADRTGWAVSYVDSEETVGEGPDNGRALFVLDGKLTTFWHTKWQGGPPPLPHTIVIDMHSEQTIAGLTFVNRQNSQDGAARKIEVSTGKDGKEWSEPLNYTISTGNGRKYVYFPEKVSAKYFKIVITATYGNKNYTFFAELGAFL